jgi:hypothetical protein
VSPVSRHRRSSYSLVGMLNGSSGTASLTASPFAIVIAAATLVFTVTVGIKQALRARRGGSDAGMQSKIESEKEGPEPQHRRASREEKTVYPSPTSKLIRSRTSASRGSGEIHTPTRLLRSLSLRNSKTDVM